MPEPDDVKTFAARIKQKYPEYAELDDLDLTSKIVSKYPDYKSAVSYNIGDFQSALRKAGWPEPEIPKMSAIMWHEGAQGSVLPNRKASAAENARITGGKGLAEDSVGPAQINWIAHAGRLKQQGIERDDLYNPNVAAKVALDLWQKSGYSPWKLASTKYYQKYMPMALTAYKSAPSQRPIVQPQPEPVPQRLNPVLPGYESTQRPVPAAPIPTQPTETEAEQIARNADQTGLHGEISPVSPAYREAQGQYSQIDAVSQAAVQRLAQQRLVDAQRRRAQQQMQARVEQARAAQQPISTADAAWHFGMTPNEARNLTPRAREVLAQAVQTDVAKKAAGQGIAPPSLAYQNEMRAKAGLKPLKFNLAVEPNAPSPYYQPESKAFSLNEPRQIAVKPRSFTFQGPSDEDVKQSIRQQIIAEARASQNIHPEARAEINQADIENITNQRFNQYLADKAQTTENARLGPSMQARQVGVGERLGTSLNDVVAKYAPGLANIDTAAGIKSDVLRGAARGLGAPVSLRQVTPEERLFNPQAESDKAIAEFVGQNATAFLPYIGAAKLITKAGVVNPILRDALTFGIADATTQLTQTGTIDPNRVAESILTGGAMGKIAGLDPTLKRRLVAYIAPQLAAGVLRGDNPEQLAHSAITNTLFALAGGTKERANEPITATRPETAPVAEPIPEVGQAQAPEVGAVAPERIVNAPQVERPAVQVPAPVSEGVPRVAPEVPREVARPVARPAEPPRVEPTPVEAPAPPVEKALSQLPEPPPLPEGAPEFVRKATEGAAKARRAQVESATPATPKQTELPPRSETYYRGLNAEREQTGDQYYSDAKDVAEEFQAQRGAKGAIKEVKGSDLPKNLFETTNKEELARQLGIDKAYDPGFDAKAKAELQKAGYEGIRYSDGTFGADEIHVFGKAATPEPAQAELAQPIAAPSPAEKPPMKAAQPAPIAETTATLPAEAASVPFMVTRKMRADLGERGYSEADIDKMTPQQANEILASPTEVAPAIPKGEAKVEQPEADKFGLGPLAQRGTEIATREPNVIFATRLGDFYEFPGDVNAQRAGETLETTVTRGRRGGPPLTGVPEHSIGRYIQAAKAKGIEIRFAEGSEPPEARIAAPPEIPVETPTTRRAARVEKFAKAEKVNRAGLNATQIASVREQLQSGIEDLGVASNPKELEAVKPEKQISPAALSAPKESLTIKVPDDGEFTVRTQVGASRLAQKLTGEPLEGFEKQKGTTVPKGTYQGKPPNITPEVDLDSVLGLYRGDEARTLRALEGTLKQARALPEAERDFRAESRQEDLINQLKARMENRPNPQPEPEVEAGIGSKVEPTKPTRSARVKTELPAKPAEPTVRDLWGTRTRTPAVKSLIRDVEDGVSYVADLSPDKARIELDSAQKNWQGQLKTLQDIADGKKDPTGRLHEDWQYQQGKLGKPLPPDRWAMDYAIPEAKTMLRQIARTRNAVDKLVPSEAEPSTVTAARKRLAKTEKPNLKEFLKSEKGEFDPQVLVDHLIVHGYDAFNAGKVKFEDWANEMRSRFKDFREEIEPHLKDVYAKLTKPTEAPVEAEAKPAPEAGIKERRLPKTLEAAEMETGNKPLYFPKSIIEGADQGRKIVEEKGVDGAIEHVLHGEPGIDWASTGFATLNEMRRQETALRDSGDIKAADLLRQKKEDFAGNFSERATRLGQGIAGVKAIEEFAPDRAAYIANKASQKGRGKPLSVEEEQRITTAGERLGELKARERANDEAFAKAKAKATKAAVKRETYQDKLEAEAQKIVLTLKPKIGKLDLGSLGTFKVGERGAVRTRIAPLEGDAELIAKYAASRLNKVDTVDALNKELTDMFGPELEPYLSPIRQRAFEIRAEARRAEIASRETEPTQRRTILKEIQKEISDTRKSLEEAKTEQKVQAKTELGVYKKGEAEGRAEFAREARRRLDQLREEYKAASKAEREGYRRVIRAQREAARVATLWDTPLRDAATEAKARLPNADPKSPDTMNDLVAVGTEKFLNEKIGGTGRVKPINPSQFYADLKAEYPDLVTKSNQAEIYKRSYERIKDAASAAREAAKQRTASAESQRLWDELGIDKDAQAILIERSEIARQQLEERTKMVREFNRVSQPLWKKGLFETQALARALKSSIDAPLGRQGLAISIMHPIETVRYTVPATIKGYAAFRHGTYTERVIEQQAHPDYDLGRRAGLDLTELASEHDPRIKAEEQFQSTLAEKIPHVRLSEQGFILGMNEQRLQAFSRFADAGRAQGYTWENKPEFFKEAAQLVNDMTGRGHMTENVQKFSSSVGNWLFYSTRLNVSRLQLLNDFLNPKKYMQYDPVTRKLMAQDLARLTLGMAGIYLGAKALGFGVTMNPNDPDFGKVRVGKTHYDVTGGEAGTIRYLYRLAAGTLKLGIGQPVAEQDSPYNISKNFLRQKLAPVPGTVVDYLAGTDITGQPKNLKFNQPQLVQRNILINMVTPMIVADMFDAYNEEGWKGVGKNVPGLAGIGVQNYLATPEVGEVRRQADILNQQKKKVEGEFEQEVARTKLGRSAAELNKMSAEAKKAPTTAERDKILNEMKRIAALSLVPVGVEKERLSKINPQVQAELKRLKTEGFSGEVNLPDNELKLGGKTIPLTDPQWEKYVILFTDEFYRRGKNILDADGYKNVSDDIKRKRWDRVRSIAHQAAKIKMKQQLSQ